MKNSDIDKIIASIGKRNAQLIVSRSIEEKLSAGFYSMEQLHSRSINYYNRYFSIAYVLHGEGTFTDSTGITHKLRPGTLLIRHPGTIHSMKRHVNWFEFACAIPVSLYNAIAKAGIIETDLYCCNSGLSIKIIEKMIDYVDSLTNDKCIGIAYSKFIDLYMTMLNATTKRFSIPPETDVIEQAKHMLFDSIEERIDIPGIAKKLGMGYENFRKKFTKTTGCSPGKYRILLRLDQADEMLRRTDMLIKEIAMSLGYNECSDFVQQYRKFKGENPTRFRKEVVKSLSL